MYNFNKDFINFKEICPEKYYQDNIVELSKSFYRLQNKKLNEILTEFNNKYKKLNEIN